MTPMRRLPDPRPFSEMERRRGRGRCAASAAKTKSEPASSPSRSAGRGRLLVKTVVLERIRAPRPPGASLIAADPRSKKR